MSTVDVLTSIQSANQGNIGSNGKIDRLGSGKQEAASGQENLFSVLMNSLIGTKLNKAEQIPEEQMVGEQVAEKQSLNAENMLGPNSYLQMFHGFFPAGKEANSGLEDQQGPSLLNLSPVNLTGIQVQDNCSEQLSQKVQQEMVRIPLVMGLDQDSQGQEVVKSIKEIGSQGMMNPSSRESQSLNPKELDQYIKAIAQLEELSGTISITKGTTATTAATTTISTATTTTATATTATATISSKVEPSLTKGSTQPEGQGFIKQAVPIQADDVEIKEADKSQQALSSSDKTGALLTRGAGNGQNLTAGKDGSGEKSLEGQKDVLNPAVGNQGSDQARVEESFDSRINHTLERGRTWEQVLDVLKKQEYKDREVKELSIRLQPAELGKVNITVRMENGQVHLMMSAAEPATGALLQNQMQELKNGLDQMGLSCGNFEMNQRQGENSSAQQEFSQTRNGYRHTQEEELISLPKNNTYYAANGSGVNINISA